MLILSRNIDQSIIVILPNKEEILVKILGTERGRVTVGFEAPDDVKIIREELIRR